jgi:HEXXH motif-containing protein
MPEAGPGFERSTRELADARAQKGRAAFEALRRVVPCDEALAASDEGRAFLDAASLGAAAGAAAIEPVWADPTTYYRVRVCTDLYRAVRGSAAPPLAAALIRSEGGAERAFRRALASWEQVAVSLALADGRDLVLRMPLAGRTPIALPGLDLVLGGDVPAAGVRAGVPVAEDGSPVPFERCPRVRVGRLEVRMSPYSFMVPGYVSGLPGLDYQREQQPLAEEAYGLIQELLPGTFEEMADGCRVLAMKPYHASDFVNQTHSHFPGGAMLSTVPHPYELADKLVHEWAHDRLFALEEEGAFLSREGTLEERHYSPWRDEPRSLRGLLHAVFVHVHVFPFWSRVHAAASPPAVAALARDRLVRYSQQLRIGASRLRGAEGLTARGQALVAWLDERAQDFHREVTGLGLTPGVPAHIVIAEGTIVPELGPDGSQLTVGASVEAHARRGGAGDALAALAARGS